MAVKTKLETQDDDTIVDIPLFATIDDTVSHISLDDESTIIEITVENEE